jgi:DNA-binding transcriptional LysR family regulator
MPDRRLQVFYAVAKQGSFTRAADALFMTQPAVTFQIKQLEEHLNTRLFERGHGKISLTPAGDLALEYAERILALGTELDTRVREMTDRLSGPLLIGASMTIAEFLLPRILGEFKAAYPNVQAKLSVANSETIESRVAAHALDVGLIEAPSDNPALVVEPCCEDELQVVVAADHPLARQISIAPTVLVGLPYISREAGSGTREFTDLYFKRAGIAAEALATAMELGSPEAIKGVVETGVGYAILSRVAVQKELQLGTLCAIPLNPRLMRVLSLVHSKERFRSKLVDTFATFTRARLSEASVAVLA